MREILFRGKRKDNGEWIVGHLIWYEDGRVRINPSHTDVFCYQKDDSIIQTVAYEVIPETVGQDTGLVDNKGKKIFEGDIINTKKYGKIIGNINVNDFDIFQIQYEPCMFRLVNKNRVFNLIDNEFSKYEVIGNVHDNPEMLGG